MNQTAWMIISLFATSIAFAQEPASVASGAAVARKALGDMRLTAEEPPQAAPVPEVPEGQPVPDPVEEITHLTYDKEPGLSLFRNIKAMDDLARRPCSNASCLGLWGIQEYYASGFSSGYKATIPLLYTADKMLGDAAHDLAAQFCSRSFTTGDENATSTLFRMLYTHNEAMSYLKIIQSNAGRKGNDVAACVPSELTVNGKSLAPKPPPSPKPAKPKPTKPK